MCMYTHRMKELELEDRQYAIDKELNKLMSIPGMWEITENVLRELLRECTEGMY